MDGFGGGPMGPPMMRDEGPDGMLGRGDHGPPIMHQSLPGAMHIELTPVIQEQILTDSAFAAMAPWGLPLNDRIMNANVLSCQRVYLSRMSQPAKF